MPMRYYLVDNGTLRPEGYLNLRRIAAALSKRVGAEVLPTSLLHSRKIPAEKLGGIPAITWERQLKRDFEAGEREFGVLPLFLSPSAAITEYMPERIERLREKLGPFSLQTAPFLFPGYEDGGEDLLRLLETRIRASFGVASASGRWVVLVDHGSPKAEVVQVRNFLAGRLRERLRNEVAGVLPASMESRSGEDYAFNRPLLEDVLREPFLRESRVIISMFFLSPGRHAGPGGDVAQICEAAAATGNGPDYTQTRLLADDEEIVDLLVKRVEGFR